MSFLQLFSKARVQSVSENRKARSLELYSCLTTLKHYLWREVEHFSKQCYITHCSLSIANYFVQLNLFKIRDLLRKSSVRASHKNPIIQEQVAPILNSFVHTRACSSRTLYRMRRCCPGRNANNLDRMILLKKTQNLFRINLFCNTFCIHKRNTGKK